MHHLPTRAANDISEAKNLERHLAGIYSIGSENPKSETRNPEE
jgi:hypothetical protein